MVSPRSAKAPEPLHGPVSFAAAGSAVRRTMAAAPSPIPHAVSRLRNVMSLLRSPPCTPTLGPRVRPTTDGAPRRGKAGVVADVLVVYQSRSGGTQALCEAVVAGCGDAGSEPRVLHALDAGVDDVRWA